MNRRFFQRMILAVVLPVAAVSSQGASDIPTPVSSTKAAARSQHIKERIDSLFKRRQKPEPLPVILPNPFLVIGGAIDSGRNEEAESGPATETVDENQTHLNAPVVKNLEEPAVNTDAEALAHYVLLLKIGGIVQLNGEPRIIINQSPRKEGDLVFLDKKDSATYLRVVRITAVELTLGFNDAVQTIRLRK